MSVASLTPSRIATITSRATTKSYSPAAEPLAAVSFIVTVLPVQEFEGCTILPQAWQPAAQRRYSASVILRLRAFADRFFPSHHRTTTRFIKTAGGVFC